MNKPKLRLGLLLDSFDIPAWAFIMLERIKQSDYAEFRLLILNNVQKADSEKKTNILFRIMRNWHDLLYIFYTRFENRKFKPNPDAFETKNSTDLLADIPILRVTPVQSKNCDWFNDRDIEKIKKHEIDVLVRLGFRILKGKILESAGLGVWSFHHGDNRVNRGGPPGFWEVFEDHSVTGSILQILSEDLDNGMILYRSYSRTDKPYAKENTNNYYWKTLSFFPRKLKELYDHGYEAFLNKAEEQNRHLRFYSRRLYKKPKNIEMAKGLANLLKRHIYERVYKLFFVNQWILMFDLRDEFSNSLWRFKKIIPPKDRHWADPYIIYKDSRYYIFFEEFETKQNKGYISLIVMDEKGGYTEPVKILEKPYHLSYPFVFEYDGDYYMIPESASNKTIEVYKCIDFPHKWEFQRTLMEDITAVDTTLFHHNQKWWLFTNLRENDGASLDDELFLFHSDSPLSADWKSHPKNPIVSDVRRARPAGKIIEHNGHILRPSQDCSKAYGYGIRINQIILLSETEYEENDVDYIEPNWDSKLKGVHTINYRNRLTIIDALLRRSKLL